MTTKEVSTQIVLNDTGEPIAAVIGDREPKMFSLPPFKRTDYEHFLNEFSGREGKIKEEKI